MSIPHRCPVCEGRGEVGKRLAQINSVLVSQKPLRFKCHSCIGTGIVWDTTPQFGLWPTQIYPNIGGSTVSWNGQVDLNQASNGYCEMPKV